MKPPCMIVTSQVLPAVRVLVAKDLIETHELRPTIVAHKMGLTPAAVTQYVSGARGGKLVHALQESERVKRLLDRLVSELLKAQPDQYALMAAVCELCRVIREERMLCKLCDSSARIEGRAQCDACLRLPR